MFQKTISLLIFSICFINFNIFGSVERFEVDKEFTIPILPNWSIDTSKTDYPYRILHDNINAELNIFKSLLEPNERVNNNKEFKEAVQGIIDDILFTLPDAQLLINEGFYEKDHLSFELEFTSFDTTSGITLSHFIKSFIYRLSDNYQIMFTLWSKMDNSDSDLLLKEVKFYQDNFTYTGEAEQLFYPKRNQFYKWFTLFSALILFFVGIYVILRMNKSRNSIQ